MLNTPPLPPPGSAPPFHGPVATPYEVERPFEICRWPKEASRTAWLTSNPRFLSLNRKTPFIERQRYSRPSDRAAFSIGAGFGISPWPRNRFTMRILKYKYAPRAPRRPASTIGSEENDGATIKRSPEGRGLTIAPGMEGVGQSVESDYWTLVRGGRRWTAVLRRLLSEADAEYAWN